MIIIYYYDSKNKNFYCPFGFNGGFVCAFAFNEGSLPCNTSLCLTTAWYIIGTSEFVGAFAFVGTFGFVGTCGFIIVGLWGAYGLNGDLLILGSVLVLVGGFGIKAASDFNDWCPKQMSSMILRVGVATFD